MSNSELASEFIDWHDPDRNYRDPIYTGPCELIDAEKIDRLTKDLLDFIAHVIATIIDAGSECDAVNENETLYKAIKDEVRSWTRLANEEG